MLEILSQAIFAKNYKLYLEHEKMLDLEKVRRSELAKNFQEQMNKLQEDINVRKDRQQAEFDTNTAIRTKIQKAIDEYKSVEMNYKKEMDAYQNKVKAFEGEVKVEMDKKLNGAVDVAKKHRAAYEKTEGNVQELSSQIKLYIDKFDQLKTDISESGQKFELNQQDIEHKRMSIQLLEAQLKNVELTSAKKQKMRGDIEEEKKRLTAQIQTLGGLKSALTMQLQS